MVPTTGSERPWWTELDYYKCPNCTRESTEHRYCPTALSLVDLVTEFSSSLSWEEVDVRIETHARSYAKQTSLQTGVGSLVGLCMVTSGCPILEKLKPMVVDHLPFATLGETTYRVAAMYMLAQYFLQQSGGEPDWELTGLVNLYDDVRVVNRHFVNRLSAAASEDASLNALVQLDMFASHVTHVVDAGMLDELKPFFSAYLDGNGNGSQQADVDVNHLSLAGVSALSDFGPRAVG